MPNYHALNEPEATALARTIPNFFDQNDELSCAEIGDGNLNLVFRVTNPVGKGLILKQALPYAKIVGESWPLTLDRARIESEALLIYGGLCRDLVPEVYLYDPVLALTVMEDLSDHTIMRKGLMERKMYPHFAEHIGRFLAHALFFTSDLGMNQQDKKLRQKQFVNPELCKITEDLIFDEPYTDAKMNQYDESIADAVREIWRDQELQLQVAVLRGRFLTCGQSLIHGDLHTGSIFVTESSTKVIDPEFAFYGPGGFDIGAVIGNLLLNYAAQEAWSANERDRIEYRGYLLQMIEEIWRRFSQHFGVLWDNHLVDRMAAVPGYRELYMRQLLRDAFGYSGCKMIRRIIGLAHVADIDSIADTAVRERAQRIALAIGAALVKRHAHSADIAEIAEIAAGALRERLCGGD